MVVNREGSKYVQHLWKLAWSPGLIGKDEWFLVFVIDSQKVFAKEWVRLRRVLRLEVA